MNLLALFEWIIKVNKRSTKYYRKYADWDPFKDI